MNFQWLHDETLQIIFSSGYWSVVSCQGMFGNPSKAKMLWHDQPQVSKSESFALFDLNEIVTR